MIPSDCILTPELVKFGEHIVVDGYIERQGKQNRSYVIRVKPKDSPVYMFVTGLDLTRDGYYWLGSIKLQGGNTLPPAFHRKFAPIARILNMSEECSGEDWQIFNEDNLYLSDD